MADAAVTCRPYRTMFEPTERRKVPGLLDLLIKCHQEVANFAALLPQEVPPAAREGRAGRSSL
jgi:hypothetical protein